MDRYETDELLRETFRKNAPPDDDAHLAAALRPDKAAAGAAPTRRVPKRSTSKRALHFATVTVAAVVLAAAVGIGSWQAATHLGGNQHVVVITDQTTSTKPDATRLELTDGHFTFAADRQADLQNVQLPTDELAEKDYHAIDNGPVLDVTLSDDAEKVAIKGQMGQAIISATGQRRSLTDTKAVYEFDAFAGGRFVVWFTYEGLQAEFTEYGSGRPIVLSLRGRLTGAGQPETFDEVWRASLAAVNALAGIKVSMTQTLTGTGTAGDGPAVTVSEQSSTSTAEELFEPGRASLTVHESDRLIRTSVANGAVRLDVTIDPILSSKAPAERTTSLEAPAGAALPLWAGDAVQPREGYADLPTTGSGDLAEAKVTTQAGGNKVLSWKRTTSEGTRVSAELALDARYLPVTLDVAGRAQVEGADTIDYSIHITYQFDVASLTDADFSVDVPDSAVLTSDIYELRLDAPLSDQANWGQYWLGPHMGDWSLATARFELHSDHTTDDFVFLSYRNATAGRDGQQVQVSLRAANATVAADARQLADQQVGLKLWQKSKTTIAGKAATVYMGPADGGGDRVDEIYVFLPDAYISIDLWDLADAGSVLAAIVPVTKAGETRDSTTGTGTGAAWMAAEAATRGAPDLLAAYSTTYEGTEARRQDVRVATEYASGVLLQSGEECDLDRQIGPRTRERGFTVALDFVGPGVTGEDPILSGALSQVATTLFNAALEAGLDITQRDNNAIFISHYPKGRDAAIVSGTKNLRFVNDTGHVVWIAGQSDGITTTFRIYGTDDGRTVEISPGEFYNVVPKTTTTEVQPAWPAGQTAVLNAGQDGRELDLHRTVTMPDGRVIHDDTFHSVWPMIPQEMAVAPSA